MEDDLVAVEVSKGERTTKDSVDRSGDDRVAVGGEGIVNVLDISGMKPDLDVPSDTLTPNAPIHATGRNGPIRPSPIPAIEQAYAVAPERWQPPRPQDRPAVRPAHLESPLPATF